jgi:hypothetical protein
MWPVRLKANEQRLPGSAQSTAIVMRAIAQ